MAIASSWSLLPLLPPRPPIAVLLAMAIPVPEVVTPAGLPVNMLLPTPILSLIPLSKALFLTALALDILLSKALSVTALFVLIAIRALAATPEMAAPELTATRL